ncbi:hypothetical protein LOZ36_000010 [Ophidiomyces ophidiicola]|nr:hypothetical protein LOZ36_000010 [Ophidiomyces ophidiicola]
MQWFQLALSVGSLMLLPGLGHARPSPEPSTEASLARRQPPAQPPFTPGGFAYRGSYLSPLEVRSMGGFWPSGADWEARPEAFNLDRHVNGGENGVGVGVQDPELWRSAYVTVGQTIEAAQQQPGGWLYVIRATPNMLYGNGYPESYAYALGGVLWQQVIGWHRVQRGPNGEVSVEYPMTLNREYEHRVYDGNPACQASSSIPPNMRNPDRQTYGQHNEDDEAVELMEDWTVISLVGLFPFQWRHYEFDEDVPGPLEGLPEAAPIPAPPVQRRLSGDELLAAAEYLAGLDEGHRCEIPMEMWNEYLVDEADHDLALAFAYVNETLGHHAAGPSHGNQPGPSNGDQLNPPNAHPPAHSPARPNNDEDLDRAVAEAMQWFDQQHDAMCTLLSGACGFMGSPNRRSDKDKLKAPKANLNKFCQRLKKNYHRPLTCKKTDKGVCEDARARCSTINYLVLDIALGDYNWGGTYDNILAMMGHHWYMMAEAPGYGDHAQKIIDLEKSYGTKTVRIRDMHGIVLMDHLVDAVGAGDQWYLQDVKLVAQCEGSRDRIHMDKFIGINKWVGHQGAARESIVWNGWFGPEDWRQEKPGIGQKPDA